MELIQIVPKLPPSLSGVGDYASLLAQQLQSAHGVWTRFLLCDAETRDDTSEMTFPVRVVPDRRAEAMLAAIGEASSTARAAVLLHYVGYGYARRGCPFWLVSALEAWKKRHASVPLIVLFHELYGMGPIWTSGFWTSPAQRWLARRLGLIADCCRITTAHTAGQLRALIGAGRSNKIVVCPVFSTVGEPSALPLLAERRRELVVFGSHSCRENVYFKSAGHLSETCGRLGVERIVDIGSPLPRKPVASVPVVEMGVLPAGEASAVFANALGGFFAYPFDYLGKSTIFAAYCSHRMLPICPPPDRTANEDGVVVDEHLMTAGSGALRSSEARQRVADSALQWYQRHNMRAHARDLHRLMLSVSAAGADRSN